MNKKSKTAFGEFLVDEIRKAGMTQEQFYNAVGIKKPYFYDLLTSAPPPTKMQKRMLQILDDATGINLERRTKLFELAAQGRYEIPADINDLIITNSEKWDDIRKALTIMLTAQDKGK